jgi:hypothetical protein
MGWEHQKVDQIALGNPRLLATGCCQDASVWRDTSQSLAAALGSSA